MITGALAHCLKCQLSVVVIQIQKQQLRRFIRDIDRGGLCEYTPRLHMTDSNGNPTGEPILNIDPRAFLVIGNLNEFVVGNGVNVSKFRAFESFRRNLRRPEIITFDELLNRARFIVEHDIAGEGVAASDEDDSDIPF